MSPSRPLRRTERRTLMVCARCKRQHIRATTGRFIANDIVGSESDSAAQPSTSTPKSPDETLHPRVEKTTQLPEYPLDLNALCDGTETVASRPSPGNDDATSLIPASHGQGFPATPTWSESWYLSFVVQMTNSEQNRLYQPIIDDSDRPSPASADRDSSAGATSRSRAKQHPEPHLNTGIPPRELLAELLDQYFTCFHVFCPIIDKNQFLKSVDDQSVSPVLLRCVLFVASIHCELKILHRLGYNGRIEAEDDLFNKAQALFNMDSESDRLTMLLCSYLLHHWSGSPNKTKDSLWWLAGAIRLAQAMGMHRKIQQSTGNPAMGRLWKRIWWLLYIRDRQIALSLGKPMIISNHDCDIEPVTESDFADEPRETGLYVVAQARLSLAVSDLYRQYLSPANEASTSEPDYIFSTTCNVFSDWYRQLPPIFLHNYSSQLSIILNLTFNYYRIILHQIMQRRLSALPSELLQASNGMIMDAAEAITSLIEDAVTHWEARYFPMICLSAVFASMTAQYTQSRSPILSEAQNKALMQSVKYKLLALKEFEDCHVIAKWIRHLFTKVMNQQKIAPNARYGAPQTAYASGDNRDKTPDAATQSASSRSEELTHAPPDTWSWGEWPLTQDLGHLDTALVDGADFTIIGQLPFPWSDYSNGFNPP